MFEVHYIQQHYDSPNSFKKLHTWECYSERDVHHAPLFHVYRTARGAAFELLRAG